MSSLVNAARAVKALAARVFVAPPPPAWLAVEKVQRKLAEPVIVTNGRETIATYIDGSDPDHIIREIVRDYPTESYRGLDLAVWRNGYLVATIRQRQDDFPELTRFPFEW